MRIKRHRACTVADRCLRRVYHKAYWDVLSVREKIWCCDRTRPRSVSGAETFEAWCTRTPPPGTWLTRTQRRRIA
jgi:hypothetical protein